MSLINNKAGIQPVLRDEFDLRDKAMSGDLVWVVTPATVGTTATDAAWERTVHVELQTASGEVHEWFSDVIATGNSIAHSSSAGVATIAETDLDIVDGQALVTITGTEADWLGGTAQVDAITCTTAVTAAGTITLTVTALGMVETIVDVVVTTAMNTVTLVADAAVLALNANSVVGAFFTADNTAGAVSLTAVTPAADDDTLSIVYADDSSATSVVFGSSSNTAAGVAKETDTYTVAAATILGYSVAEATSVETFED
jgi:hypothetical protein